jgi:hypothetical protein
MTIHIEELLSEALLCTMLGINITYVANQNAYPLH